MKILSEITSTVSMYSGKVEDVTLRFRLNVMNAVVDQFGRQDYVKVEAV